MAGSTTRAAPSPWLGLFLLALLVVIVVAFYREALKTPTGEGVPGPVEWARTSQRAP